jgi:hypothetical protein
VGGWPGEGGELVAVGELLMDLSRWGQSRDAEGRRPAARPGLGTWSALGSRPRVALSSAQAPPVYLGPRPTGHSGLGHLLASGGNGIRLGLRAWTSEDAQGSPPTGGLSA